MRSSRRQGDFELKEATQISSHIVFLAHGDHILHEVRLPDVREL